jgi:hypothetical protein
MVNTIRNLRTIRGLRGNGLKIDLGKTFDGTLVASMRKDSDNNTIRNFTIDSNRYLLLSESETLDDVTNYNTTVENISGKWKFDVKQTVGIETKAIYTGTIYFENGVTGATKNILRPYVQEITVTSDDLTYTIPCGDSGTYSASIDWGDENKSNITSFDDSNLSHKFKKAGTYLIQTTGDLPQVFFDNGGDKDKIIDIPQWGDVIIENARSSYYGCSNLVITATDAPTITSNSLFRMFRDCTSLAVELVNWDVSLVSSFATFLYGATSINPAIEGWDYSSATDLQFMLFNASNANPDFSNTLFPNVTTMANMLDNSGLTTDNYDNLLNGLSGQTVQSGVPLGASGVNYTIATAGASHDDLSDNDLWVISDNGGI